MLSREPEDGSSRISALLEGPERASAVRCRYVLVASGAHDASPRFGNNDLPGIVSARAALKLLRAGISIGKRVALVGEGRFARAFAEARAQQGVFRFEPARVLRAKGKHAVSRIVYDEAGKSREFVVSALAYDGPVRLRSSCSPSSARACISTQRAATRRGLGQTARGRPRFFAAGSCAASALLSAADGARVARLVPTDQRRRAGPRLIARARARRARATTSEFLLVGGRPCFSSAALVAASSDRADSAELAVGFLMFHGAH